MYVLLYLLLLYIIYIVYMFVCMAFPLEARIPT